MSSSCRSSRVPARWRRKERRRPFRAGSLFHFPAETWHAAEFDEDTVPRRNQLGARVALQCWSAGSLPPLAANFDITSLCSHVFIEAESLVSPV